MSTVRKIIKSTKTSHPKKYRLDNKRWYTQDRLNLAAEVDNKSEDLINNNNLYFSIFFRKTVAEDFNSCRWMWRM